MNRCPLANESKHIGPDNSKRFQNKIQQLSKRGFWYNVFYKDVFLIHCMNANNNGTDNVTMEFKYLSHFCT